MRVKSERVVEVERGALERVLGLCRAVLLPQDFEILEAAVDTLARMVALVRERGSSMVRLRRLFGLSGSEKSRDVLPPSPLPVQPAPPADAASIPALSAAEHAVPPAAPASPPTASPPADAAAKQTKTKRKGHGRIPASAYAGACHIPVPHATLHAGGTCPKCAGRVHPLAPVPILRIVGHAPLAAKCWDCESTRCGSCGAVYTARAPQEAQGEKCEESACVMIAILHYRSGVPFNCLAVVQRNLDTPVPASTQWDVVNKGADLVQPVFDELVRLAAQGEVLHNDDSYVRILGLMGSRRAKLLAEGKLPDPDRTGLFTTAIVALIATIGTIALFFTGRNHAGENLTAVLAKRAAGLAAPIHMGDAATRNLPNGHEVIASSCITHGRRQIVDEIGNYPDECRYVIERLALVYKVDDECKERSASPGERLLAHQQQSAAAMEEIRVYMDARLHGAKKYIEPNSDLGKAFNYFLSRWDRFIVFLREPGAPLDNNIAERALKMAIKHRNASLFYRSERGAKVGDIYMTLIYTAELHHQNPFDYLTALQRNYNAVAATPGDWLPWTYKATLARMAPREPVLVKGRAA